MQIALILFALQILGGVYVDSFKTVTKIESCADSGRCRVYFDDNSTDLVFSPHIGMKVRK